MERKKIKKILHAEKIAAGEVIERPANVVKELIENSIDAGAREIKILIKNAGKTLIEVIDDGVGIPPEEMEIAFQRYTSSKICSIEDLESLQTLGFRGEALASIAAISKIQIMSRIEENELGTQMLLEGGKIIEKKSVSCPRGTDMKVLNLFYNLPARKKFLKSNYTELGHITDIVQRYALANPELHFYYAHDDMEILNCPLSNDLKTTVFHLHGKNISREMIPFEYTDEEETISLYGLLGSPKIVRKSRRDSSIFLNKRYITSDIVFKAVQEAYKGTIMVNRHPFFILFLEIDPSRVDFNVHPKKLHVRFEDEELIYSKIHEGVRQFVKKHFMREEKIHVATELKEFMDTDSSSTESNTEHAIEEMESESKVIEKEAPMDSPNLSPESIQTSLLDHVRGAEPEKKYNLETLIREKYIVEKNFPRIRLISHTGQLSNKKYVLLEGMNQEGEEGLFILDQHAASERVTKEYFLELLKSSKKQKQKLISPMKIEVSPSEKYYLLENLSQFHELGFTFEHFGGNTFILRDIPLVFDKTINPSIIKEIISDITEIGKEHSFSEVKEKIINYLSCHKSIRGGDDLSLKDIRDLLIQLASCKDPYHCAHGRPVLKFISFKELDKLFKRTG
ncbi:MAG: DNA mismatch repair endonuclease MutL [Promethearchaeota archaeon]